MYRYKWRAGSEEGDEETEEERLVKQKAHRLLVAVCTSSSVGILEDSYESNLVRMTSHHFSSSASQNKTNGNTIVLRFLSGLNDANENELTADLVVKILSACGGIRHKYLASMPYSFDPRLSEKWFKNTDLFMRILAEASLHPSQGNLRECLSCKLLSASHIVECIIPSPISRQFLSQGVQNKEVLVVARTLQMLMSVFGAYNEVVAVLNKVLSDPSAGGHGSTNIVAEGVLGNVKSVEKLKVQLGEILRTKLPDLQTIIALKNRFMPNKDSSGVEDDGVSMTNSEVYLFVLNVMEGYLVHLPQIFSETKFDFAKLIPLGTVDCDEAPSFVKDSPDNDKFFGAMSIGHLPENVQSSILRMLCNAKDMKWVSLGGSKLSLSGHIMMLFRRTESLVIKDLCRRLLRIIFSKTGLFSFTDDESDTNESWLEIDIWINELSAASFKCVWLMDSIVSGAFSNPFRYVDMTTAVLSNCEKSSRGFETSEESISLLVMAFNILFSAPVENESESVTVTNKFLCEDNVLFVMNVWLDYFHKCNGGAALVGKIASVYLSRFLKHESSLSSEGLFYVKAILRYNQYWVASDCMLLKSDLMSDFDSPDKRIHFGKAMLKKGTILGSVFGPKVSLKKLCEGRKQLLDVLTTRILSKHCYDTLNTPFTSALLKIAHLSNAVLSSKDESASVLSPYSQLLSLIASGDDWTENLLERLMENLKYSSLQQIEEVTPLVLMYVKKLCCIVEKDNHEDDTWKRMELVLKYIEAISERTCVLASEKSTNSFISAKEIICCICNDPMLVSWAEKKILGTWSTRNCSMLDMMCRYYFAVLHRLIDTFRPSFETDVKLKNVKMLKMSVLNVFERPESSKEDVFDIFRSLIKLFSLSEIVSVASNTAQRLALSVEETDVSQNAIRGMHGLHELLHYIVDCENVSENIIRNIFDLSFVENVLNVCNFIAEKKTNDTESCTNMREVLVLCLKKNLFSPMTGTPDLWKPFIEYNLKTESSSSIEIIELVMDIYPSMELDVVSFMHNICRQCMEDKTSRERLLIFIPLISKLMKKLLWCISDSGSNEIKDCTYTKALIEVAEQIFLPVSLALLKSSERTDSFQVQNLKDGLSVNVRYVDLVVYLKVLKALCKKKVVFPDGIEKVLGLCSQKKTFYSAHQFQGAICCLEICRGCYEKREQGGEGSHELSAAFEALFMACLRTVLKLPVGDAAVDYSEVEMEKSICQYFAGENIFSAHVKMINVSQNLLPKFSKLITSFLRDVVTRRMACALRCFSGGIENGKAFVQELFVRASSSILRDILANLDINTQEAVMGKGNHCFVEEIFNTIFKKNCFEALFRQKEKEHLPQSFRDSLDKLRTAVVEFVSACLSNFTQNDMLKEEWVSILLSGYSATTSERDRLILEILFFFEKSGVSCISHSFVWGEKGMQIRNARSETTQGMDLEYPLAGETLDLLLPSQMAASMKNFPIDRALEPFGSFFKPDYDRIANERVVYDPAFLLPVINNLVNVCSSQIDARKLVESQVLSYVIISMSSRDIRIRQAAYSALSEMYVLIEGGKFKEAEQICYLLSVLRDAIDEDFVRIPSILSSFCKEAIYILHRPEHFLYTTVNKFILQRPIIDLQDVPMFYQLFNSSSANFRKERGWILRLIRDGLRDIVDYKICQRRHVFEMLLSFYDSKLADSYTRGLVLDILESAVGVKVVAEDLVKTRGLISWINSALVKEHGSMEPTNSYVNRCSSLDFNFFRITSLLKQVVQILTGVEQFIPFLLDEYVVVLNSILSKLVVHSETSKVLCFTPLSFEVTDKQAVDIMTLTIDIMRKYHLGMSKAQMLVKQTFPYTSVLALVQLAYGVLETFNDAEMPSNVVSSLPALRSVCDKYLLDCTGLEKEGKEVSVNTVIPILIECICQFDFDMLSHPSNEEEHLRDIVSCMLTLIGTIQLEEDQGMKIYPTISEWILRNLARCDKGISLLRKSKYVGGEYDIVERMYSILRRYMYSFEEDTFTELSLEPMLQVFVESIVKGEFDCIKCSMIEDASHLAACLSNRETCLRSIGAVTVAEVLIQGFVTVWASHGERGVNAEDSCRYTHVLKKLFGENASLSGLFS